MTVQQPSTFASTSWITGGSEYHQFSANLLFLCELRKRSTLVGGRQRRRGEASRASNPQPSRLSNIPAPRVYPHKTKGVMRSCFLAPPPFPSHCGASGGKIRRTLFYLSALFCPSPPASVREHHILHSIHTHTRDVTFPKFGVHGRIVCSSSAGHRRLSLHI